MPVIKGMRMSVSSRSGSSCSTSSSASRPLLALPRIDHQYASLRRSALMHIAISVIMFKLECQVIDRNPDFQMQDRDFIRRINYQDGTVKVNGITHFLRDTQFPTVDPKDPARLTEREA